jgi:glycosyltransferase involved in cell wall biosynthesis
VRCLSSCDRAQRISSLRVAFVSEHDFSAPSEVHILGFAQELIALGHDVLMSIGGDPLTLEREGFRSETRMLVSRYRFFGPWLDRRSLRTMRTFRPDVIHAWNPRPPTLMAARQYARATAAPYFVHFEDDEFTPWPLELTSSARLVASKLRRRFWRLHPPLWTLPDRENLEIVRREACGLDALTPALAREVGVHLGRPCRVLLPALPLPRQGGEGRSAVCRREGEMIALFTGRVYLSSRPDITLAIRAVAELRARGVNIRLVQTGAVEASFDLMEHARSLGLAEDGFTILGHIPYADIAPTLRAADILVQSGPPSRFNSLRLPSKLQAYLRSGTPVVTFGVGFGEMLRNGEEALLTKTADASELADKLFEISTHPDLRERLSLGGPVAAARLFNDRTNTEALLRHYQGCAKLFNPSGVAR